MMNLGAILKGMQVNHIRDSHLLVRCLQTFSYLHAFEMAIDEDCAKSFGVGFKKDEGYHRTLETYANEMKEAGHLLVLLCQAGETGEDLSVRVNQLHRRSLERLEGTAHRIKDDPYIAWLAWQLIFKALQMAGRIEETLNEERAHKIGFSGYIRDKEAVEGGLVWLEGYRRRFSAARQARRWKRPDLELEEALLRGFVYMNDKTKALTSMEVLKIRALVDDFLKDLPEEFPIKGPDNGQGTFLLRQSLPLSDWGAPGL